MEAACLLVPWTADPPRVCAACAATSDKLPWARASVTRALGGKVVRSAPAGIGCRDCAKAALEALLPEVTDWETAISDQATKEAIPEYAKRRRGEPSAFTKQSASYITRYSTTTTWQEEAGPVLVSELKHK